MSHQVPHGSRNLIIRENHMLEFLRNMFAMRRHENERGASAVEYGLLIAGIAALIVVVVIAFGGTIQSVFEQTCEDIAVGASLADQDCETE